MGEGNLPTRKIGLIQLNSKLDPLVNLERINYFIQESVKEGATQIYLPECFYSMSDGQNVSPFLIEKGNEHEKALSNLAKKHNVFLVGGSAATKENEKVYNRSYNVTPSGEFLDSYDKINLFRCNIKKESSISIDESLLYTPGKDGNIISVEEISIGQGICFDIRFPEHFVKYRQKKVDLITIPAAFTRKTGALHWHALVRARAIECQCFVIASAQVGKHNDRVNTYGHSLVVDPWGEVIADLGGKNEGYQTVSLNFDKVREVRESIRI